MITDKEYVYNQDPVIYCRECGSLAIVADDIDNNVDYCLHCGSKDVDIMGYFEWEDKYDVDKNSDTKNEELNEVI